MIPRRASIKKRRHFKNQIKLTFHGANPRYFTPVCREDEIPGIVAHMNHLIALGRFVAEDFIPGLQKESMSLVQFSEEYLSHRENMVKRELITSSTYVNDHDSLKRFTQFTGRERLINSITVDDIDKFVDYLKGQITIRGTLFNMGGIATKLRHLKTAFSYALQNEWISRNPFYKYRIATSSDVKEEMRYLYDKEIKLIRKHLHDKPIHQLHIFDFALNTGLRAQGIINAQFRWVRKYGEYKYLRVQEKRKKSRDIPLNDTALQIIREREKWIKSGEYMTVIKNALATNHWDLATSRARAGYIFFEISSVSGLTHFFMRVKKRLKLDDQVNFHSTRHTFATKSLESGKSIEWVKHIMGHSDIRTTQIYAKITGEHIKREFNPKTVF